MEATDQEQSPPAAPQSSWGTRELAWIVAIAAVLFVLRFLPIGPLQRFFGSFSWLTEQALSLTKDLFESYGYLTVFLAPLLENTVFLGALLPGTLVMLLAGLGAHDGLISFWLAIPLGIAGAIIGDTISYGIGRFGWQRLGPEARLVRWSERMREPLLEHSIWLVLSYHFAGYSRLVGPAAAGFMRMPFLRWMVLDYAGVALWVVVYLMGGYLLGVFGLSLDDSDRNVRVFEIILFALFVIAVLSVMRTASRTRRREQATPAPSPSPDGHLHDASLVLGSEETRDRVG